ncbi:TonB-dependent receptor [Shewanella avicenniae]|uniref:TonB-dependent receptor n=1 Tax=Shewanella avicenniae TaxID=2814294 RepID=A0ABX7QPU3_9GAMM|nr:TonB-dependent receptor [Shewanella avicenniae]QSX33497.1 TonB-dependent receptor [Shewanella avicenniae]
MKSNKSPYRAIPFGLSALSLVIGSLLLPMTSYADDEEVTANAAEASKPKSSDAEMLERIEVTATRRATTLQETPLAISALSGNMLKHNGITSVEEFTKMVPGMRIEDSGPGSKRISLRGVTAPGEGTVGVYYDEIPISGTVGVSSDAGGRTPTAALFDVNRVEVVRGPQGTLYGASSMGGAIRTIFNKPIDGYEGAFETSYADIAHGGAMKSLDGMVNVPLVEGLLAARVVGFRKTSDGYIDNVFLGIDDVNGSTKEGGRVMFRLTPSDDLTIDTMYLLDKTEAGYGTWNPTIGEYETAAQINQPFTDTTKLYSGTLEWNLDFATLTAAVGHFKRATEYNMDDSYYIDTYLTEDRCQSRWNGGAACSSEQLSNYYDYVNSLTPAVLQHKGYMTNKTYEARLTSNDAKVLDWTVGAFFQKRNDYIQSQDGGADAETGKLIRPMELFYRRYIIDDYEQKAVFGETTYHATEKLDVTVGLRWFDYQKTVTGETTDAWELINAFTRPKTSVEFSESDWLFKGNVSYSMTDDMMFYATAAQGFRPGGANNVIGLAEMLTGYESDSLWNYEVGMKSSWLDRDLQFNAATYLIDWDNMQVRGRTTDGAFSFLSNAGAAQIMGLELEGGWRITDDLFISGNVNLLNAELTEDQVSDVVLAAGRDGDRIPYIPKVTGMLSLTYNLPQMLAGYDSSLRADVNYVGSSYSELSPNNAYNLKLDSYSLTNLRFNVDSTESGWGFALYVNNLFDKNAIVYNSGSSSYPNEFANSAMPRTIGVTVRKDFF